MGDFKKLLVWRKAQALALNAHRIASRMRGPGYSALRNQIIRAALSIPTNIVEGHGQASPRDFARFLGYSINSTSELEHHSLTARDLGGMEQGDFDLLMAQLIEVRKMLHGLRASRDRPRPSPTSSGPEKSDQENS
jgi:four helix bundle protein